MVNVGKYTSPMDPMGHGPKNKFATRHLGVASLAIAIDPFTWEFRKLNFYSIIGGGFVKTLHHHLGGIPKDTPRKINMEHNHGGLEDHFPF